MFTITFNFKMDTVYRPTDLKAFFIIKL